MDDLTINTYFKQACLKAIQNTVTQVLATSVQKCPVKTGQLRSSASITEANPATGQYTIAYNTNDTAPYAEIVEKGGIVRQHYRRSRRTGQPYTVQSYTVPGTFYLRDAISETLSKDYSQVVINANQDSAGYSISIQKEEKMEELDITQNQEWIIAKHSRMVGKVLDLVEAAIPEGKQCEKLKKITTSPPI